MWPLLVIADHPPPRDVSNIAEIVKEVGVENLSAEGSVEALDVGILSRFSRLNMMESHSLLATPVLELLRDEFRAIIYSDLFGKASAFFELFK